MQLFANKKYIISIFAVFIILMFSGIWFYFFNKSPQKENQIQEESQILMRNQNQSAISEIKKTKQNKTELKIPEELTLIILDDAVRIYFDNFGDECYKTKGIIEPQLKLPKTDFGTWTDEEINALASQKYDLVYKALRPKLTIQDYEYSYEISDLNNDGVDEFIVEPQSLCALGSGSLRGGTGNGAFLFYQKFNNNWKNIGEINGSGYELLETTNENYRNLRSFWNLSASCYKETLYKWDKEKLFYKSNSFKDVGVCD